MSPSEPYIYDFIIVGGGNSGAVVAGNIARSQQRPRVLVIEEGGDNKRADLRVASERFVNPYVNPEIGTWYKTTPQKHLEGRSLDYLRGRGLGGSSIANYQAYIRGSASDYNEWAARVGDDFFAWHNAVARYKELENLHFEDDGDKDHFVQLKEAVHGFEGPLDISIQPKKRWHFGMDKNMQAAIEFGWPVCRDQNSGDPIGVGVVTTTSYRGYRTTSGSAYLFDVPSNLDVWCHTTAAKILFEPQSSGNPKAVGLQLANGRIVQARKEVILSAGAIDTPKLLLLSGVGPRKELNRLNIECLVHHPDVGKKLTDHLWMDLKWSVSPELSDVAAVLGDRVKAKATRQEWLRSQTGPDATQNGTNLVGFLKFNPDRANLDELEKLPDQAKNWIKRPDVPQIEIFLAGLCPPEWQLIRDGEFYGVTIMLMNPQSRGEVTLASKDPAANPTIDPGYLSHPYDRQTIINGVRESLAYIRSTFLSKYVQREVHVPKSDTDEQILDFCKENLQSVLHGCGTVRMGHEKDPMACLDTHFRVRGVDNLRVVDLSATPLITR
ncbi:hypothetical protein H2200_011828 [Cladophialophora chaetospira]|uniref:Glucose-methanol-choline oxidoreductase N-terminal domain-containing protein n=1 Tax=Cladophialophora chaetospira TaxID=386627 RepID=A0AA38WYS6_9EURO|nr:hypothetical protein H2200_011828 [Cladophialophora chaetospira]